MLRFLLRTGLRRGLLGGSRAWTVIGGVALAARLLKKLAGNEPVVVLREELRPGEALLIANERDATVRGHPS